MIMLRYFKSLVIIPLYFLCFVEIAFGSQSDIPFFKAYPKFKEHIPYIPLGNLESTPIYHAHELNLYVKHDGVHGTDKNGTAIFTGNKRRKLEFLLADAVAKGARRIYAPGAAGSNFATATAAYAREVGIACTLILGPQRNTYYAQRNLKLDLFYDADIVACKTRDERVKLCHDLATNDTFGYFVPLGGSNKIGTLGYVNAAFELKEQIEKKFMPKPDVIYVAVSSAAMAAGLIIGLKAANLNIQVNPVGISDTIEEIQHELIHLIQETSEYLHAIDQQFPLITVTPHELNVIMMAGDEYVDADHAAISRNKSFAGTYALTTPQGAQAIKQFDIAAGIKLDGTYAGKAFAACTCDMASEKLKGKTVLFWDSFCPGEFNECICLVDTKKLPEELQKYIDGTYSIQVLDQGV